jgi:(2Fe-2S) ferredoxin
MPTVKSLDDLKRIREEALKKRELEDQSGSTEIIVGMGTPGIAAGARETMKSILDFIETHQLTGIVVRQTGNIGMDSHEPIVQVTLPGKPKVTYGKVTADRVGHILQMHVIEGNIVQDYVIEA